MNIGILITETESLQSTVENECYTNTSVFWL